MTKDWHCWKKDSSAVANSNESDIEDAGLETVDKRNEGKPGCLI